MQSKKIYNPGSIKELRKLTEILSDSFIINPERTVSSQHRFYDTFDWRLFNSGHYLISGKNNFSLFHFDSEWPEIELNFKDTGKPVTWNDFPEGEFRALIHNFISVRALLPSPEFRISSKVIRLLNEDRKIVARLETNTISTVTQKGRAGTARILKTKPVKGYSKEFQKVIKALRQLNISEEETDTYFIINELLGLIPGSYTSKSIPVLSPDMKSRDAIKLIISGALNTISLNEPGIINDIDTEFLHDFRVSARRARSITAQFRDVFDETTAAKLKKDLSYLGKLSNNLRDLDVYLLKKDRLRRLLPEDLSVHLEYLFRIMKRERNAEHKNITGTLKSEEYKSIIEKWKKYVSPDNDKPEKPAKFSETNIKALAGKIIRSEYKRVTRLGRSITETTPDEEIHKLRIECKKLRYLLETFVSLFPLRTISELIFRLKILQDYLGDFNDLSLQQERMNLYMEVLAKKNIKNKMVFAAIGGLTTHLYFEQIRAREAFYKTFREFDTKLNARLINEITK